MSQRPQPMAAALMLAAVVLSIGRAAGQGPSFDAASIRRSPAATGGDILYRPGGAFNAENLLLLELIADAYGIQPFRVVDGPDWIRTHRYNIQARGNTAGGMDEIRLMVRRLLEDRFQMRARIEPRELPVYALVVSRRDGRLGPQLQPASAERCAAPSSAPFTGAPGALPPCGRLLSNPARMWGRRIPIDLLAQRLSSIAGRTVVNRTPLTGTFDVDLEWAPDAAPAVPQDKPGLFTALGEQLGLELESTTAPVDVLVIDRIELPTEN